MDSKKTIGDILEMTFSEEARKKYEKSPRRIRMNTVDFARARKNASERIGPEAAALLMSHKNAGLISVYEDTDAELAAYLGAALDKQPEPEFVNLDENESPEDAALLAYLAERL